MCAALAKQEHNQPPAPATSPTRSLPDESATEGNQHDARALVYFHIATGAWVAILAASLLAIVIMAHRIALAQRIRPANTPTRLGQEEF